MKLLDLRPFSHHSATAPHKATGKDTTRTLYNIGVSLALTLPLSMARLCEHAPITSAVMLQSAPIHSSGCYYRMYENLMWYGMKFGRITTNKMNSIVIPIWPYVLARNADGESEQRDQLLKNQTAQFPSMIVSVRRAENGVRDKDKVSLSTHILFQFRNQTTTVATHVASCVIVGSIFDANGVNHRSVALQ